MKKWCRPDRAKALHELRVRLGKESAARVKAAQRKIIDRCKVNGEMIVFDPPIVYNGLTTQDEVNRFISERIRAMRQKGISLSTDS